MIVHRTFTTQDELASYRRGYEAVTEGVTCEGAPGTWSMGYLDRAFGREVDLTLELACGCEVSATLAGEHEPCECSRIGEATTIPFRYDDGGRAAAGFRGEAGDCVTRAIAIALAAPYADVYWLVNHYGHARTRKSGRRSTARGGVFKLDSRALLSTLGLTWVPTMGIGTGCRCHLRADELPAQGALIVSVSKHLAAVVDGVLRDTHDCSREGTRCVYGYWLVPDEGVNFTALERVGEERAS